MSAIGIDIGGANLKFSDGHRQHFTQPFELWRQPDQLREALAKGLESFPRVDQIAIAMTGELCDCFGTRAEGVARITAAVESASAAFGPASFYQVGGRWVNATQAAREWRSTAAANWDAIARLAAREFPAESGVVLDIGSTTTDLVPIHRGTVAAEGATDFERLRTGELVYCGAARTPLGSILPEFVRGTERMGLAGEWFASLEDVFVLCGHIPERPEDRATCDGRPLTGAFALRRLARMLCTEPEEAGQPLILELAEAIKQALLDRLEQAWRFLASRANLADKVTRVVVSGSGEWLGRLLLNRVGWAGSVTLWSERFSPEASVAAAAFALARLRE
ncbi:MAG: hydantoinase/oxoprolinase family protein [Planctomycetota bacterium]